VRGRTEREERVRVIDWVERKKERKREKKEREREREREREKERKKARERENIFVSYATLALNKLPVGSVWESLYLPTYRVVFLYQGDKIGRIFAIWAIVYFGKN
jgi:septal ring factor EnvC (AmiA/AmiB activator)